MKEYKLNEIFQYEDRTLMCVEGICHNDTNCYFNREDIDCNNIPCWGSHRDDKIGG